MTTLLLVRHGATEWTRTGRLQGRTDIDLADDALGDIGRLAPAVAAWAPRTVIVSPLLRTRSTAGMLSDLDPIVDERWTEAHLGGWEGGTAQSIGADYVRWRAGELVPPGGEAATEVAARVSAAVHDASGHPGPVLIVTHGGTIRAVLAEFVGLTTDRLEPVGAPSLTVLEVGPGAARLRHLNIPPDRAVAG